MMRSGTGNAKAGTKSISPTPRMPSTAASMTACTCGSARRIWPTVNSLLTSERYLVCSGSSRVSMVGGIGTISPFSRTSSCCTSAGAEANMISCDLARKPSKRLE